MEQLKLKLRQPGTEEIECWDDDDDLKGIDDLHFRNVSSTTVVTNASTRRSHHRDSVSSRLSFKSDLEDGGDWQLLLNDNDEKSAKNAVADAKSKGIPLPANVPASALLGGTIKRLGGKRIKKVLGEEWSEGILLPTPEDGGLRLRMNDGLEFPASLRQVSGTGPATPGLAKANNQLSFMDRINGLKKDSPDLDKFRDKDDDDFGDVPTIKVAKNRSPMKIPTFGESNQKLPNMKEEEDSFDDDFDLPTHGKLKLSARKEPPRTPVSQSLDDVEVEWAEGSQASLGTSNGGVRHTGRSNRSSSMSARSPSIFSPSLSSCRTMESEDEGLDCLVLPDGPLKFEEALKRLQSASPEHTEMQKSAAPPAAREEDFFSGIAIGDGDVFDAGKLTLNRNIKHKAAKQTSPARQTATTLTFTNKPVNTTNTTTRIPKPTGMDRPRSKLEPVSESGGPVPNYRRTQSRLGGHSTQSSITSIPTPTTVSFPPNSGPSTPSRRGLVSRASRDTLRTESTTTSAQLLKAKRSMPLLSTRTTPASPARTQPTFQRPPSRTDKPLRSTIPSRPKTPVDRSESSLAVSRKPPMPFLPAGNTNSQSHHVSYKPSRTFHRPTSSDSASNENAPIMNRSISRLSNAQHRTNTPSVRRDVAPEALTKAAAATRKLVKPMRRRPFGDGNELDVFDDLPTSAAQENKFIKAAANGQGKAPGTQKSKLYSTQNQSTPNVSRIESPVRTPLSPQKNDINVPSWARSTAASRLAREQRNSSLNPHTLRHPASVDNNSLSTNWKAQSTPKPLPPARPSAKRGSKPIQKPTLIKPLNETFNAAKSVGDMHWNPQLLRWEGNEHALAPFDVPVSPKHGALGSTGKPALITNFGNVKGVQVNGGMVFDPQRMCWLKMAPGASRGRSESGAMSLTTEDDEDDPFAGLDDLEDETKSKAGATGVKGGAGSDDDWTVGEEFDVGPEFVRRQTNEEERWMKKMQGWEAVLAMDDKGFESRWAIRDFVGSGERA